MKKENDQQKILWSDFYKTKEELFYFIGRNVEILQDDSNDVSIRCICFTENQEVLKKIESLTKQLNEKYRIATKTKNNYSKAPVILQDIENIIINSYDAYSSKAIIKGSPLNIESTIKVNDIDTLKNHWGKNYEKNLKKYKLLEYTKRDIVIIGFEQLLELANAKIIQMRKATGKRYVLNIRKIGENLSKRYKYGIVIVNTKPVIEFANKEAPRKHSLASIGESVHFPFPTDLDYDLYIKEKN